MFNKKLQDQIDRIDIILNRNMVFSRHDYNVLRAQYEILTKEHNNLQEQVNLLLEHLGIRIESTPAKTEIVRNV